MSKKIKFDYNVEFRNYYSGVLEYFLKSFKSLLGQGEILKG